MKFKKHLTKKLEDTELIAKHKVDSSKSVFLIAAFVFFLNIFLVGGDKNNSLSLLKILLPLSYSFFIASLLFLSIAAIDKLLPEKYAPHKKVIIFIVAIVFLLPVLVFFIQGKIVIPN